MIGNSDIVDISALIASGYAANPSVTISVGGLLVVLFAFSKRIHASSVDCFELRCDAMRNLVSESSSAHKRRCLPETEMRVSSACQRSEVVGVSFCVYSLIRFTYFRIQFWMVVWDILVFCIDSRCSDICRRLRPL